MIPLPSMQGKTVAVLGLGRSGRSACRALRASGARVWAWDDAPARRAEAAAAGRADRRPRALQLGAGSTGWC